MSGRRLACIVEGHGEVKAVPILLRRLWEEEPSLAMPEIQSRDVIRIPRSKLLRAGELERAVELAARRCGSDGAILVLVDADDDPACELGPQLQARARGARPDMRVAVVLAVREYEAWFLAAAPSLSGSADLPDELSPPNDPEGIRDAKGWLSARMPSSRYREVIHQPKLTAKMALEPTRPCGSWDKLRREVRQLLAPTVE